MLITGIGCFGAAGTGLAAWRDRFAAGEGAFSLLDLPGVEAGLLGAPAPRPSARGLAPPALWRKMDRFAQMCVASAREAWDDAGLELAAAERDEVGVILGSANGSLDLSLEFEAAARRGPGKANAKDFPHTSMNAAAGHTCTLLGLHGPLVSFSGTGMASPAALSFAADLIRSGRAERMLVIAAEELSPATIRLARALGYRLASRTPKPFDLGGDGTCFGSAAVTVVLESAAAARRRGAQPYAEVCCTSMAGADTDGQIDAGTWRAAMTGALDRSSVEAGTVGYYAGAGAGLPAQDGPEAEALADVFGGGRLAVGAPKSIVGECLGASGAVSLVAATLAVQSGLLTPALGLADAPLGGTIDYLNRPVIGPPVDYAVAAAVSAGSAVACTVVARVGEGR